MKQVSLQYKQAMEKQFRDRSYALISVGIVNKQAQSNASLKNILYLSNTYNTLRLGKTINTYASFEENQATADGTMLFPPENDIYYQRNDTVGSVGNDILGPIRVVFNTIYDIKGLTIDFGDSYPTEFTVTNGTVTKTYEFEGGTFTCIDSFDDSPYIEITPVHFINGDDKRLRINYLLMGVGINFNNDNIDSISMSSSISYVSEELPATRITAKVLDFDKLFNVDDMTSFINYLSDGQELDFSIGQTLEDGSIEYLKMPKTYLSSWASNGSYMTFTSTNRLALLTGQYSLGNSIHERTLYDEAISVLTDAGLEPDEYFVDTVLQDITIVNPMPVVKHNEALQYIANAGRCKLLEDNKGRIKLEGNFENIIEPTELVSTATGEADLSNASNVRFGSDVIYADFTRNFVPADGSMLFIPSNSSEYLDGTTFVSSEIAKLDGTFTSNPSITLELPAAYTYYGLSILFNGNHPDELRLDVYYDDTLLDTFTYSVDRNDFYISEELIQFNKLVFSFTKGYPRDRILVNKIALGELTDYRLDKFSMKEEPVGTMEKKVKDVSVRVFTFTPPDEEGRSPEMVDDKVYYTFPINSTGQSVVFENQLISTQSHAELVAKWMSNYYANNISYSVNYRGEPRLDASDIIYLDSELLNNLQVEIESLNLNFNGSLSGKLEMRRATNMLIEEETV